MAMRSVASASLPRYQSNTWTSGTSTGFGVFEVGRDMTLLLEIDTGAAGVFALVVGFDFDQSVSVCKQGSRARAQLPREAQEKAVRRIRPRNDRRFELTGAPPVLEDERPGKNGRGRGGSGSADRVPDLAPHGVCRVRGGRVQRTRSHGQCSPGDTGDSVQPRDRNGGVARGASTGRRPAMPLHQAWTHRNPRGRDAVVLPQHIPVDSDRKLAALREIDGREVCRITTDRHVLNPPRAPVPRLEPVTVRAVEREPLVQPDSRPNGAREHRGPRAGPRRDRRAPDALEACVRLVDL